MCREYLKEKDPCCSLLLGSKTLLYIYIFKPFALPNFSSSSSYIVIVNEEEQAQRAAGVGELPIYPMYLSSTETCLIQSKSNND